MNFIYHIVTQNDFISLTTNGSYIPSNFSQDGFIHCTSDESSSIAVLNEFFMDLANLNTLLILKIDVSRLKAKVKYEPPAPVKDTKMIHFYSGQLFPHIYGKLNLESISGIGIVKIINNSFIWPSSFETLSAYSSPGCVREKPR